MIESKALSMEEELNYYKNNCKMLQNAVDSLTAVVKEAFTILEEKIDMGRLITLIENKTEGKIIHFNANPPEVHIKMHAAYHHLETKYEILLQMYDELIRKQTSKYLSEDDIDRHFEAIIENKINDLTKKKRSEDVGKSL